MNYTREQVLQIGSAVACKAKGNVLDTRTLTSFFKAKPEVIEDIYGNGVIQRLTYLKITHMFWVLVHMKLCLPFEVIFVMANVSKNTYRKYRVDLDRYHGTTRVATGMHLRTSGVLA